MEIRHIVCFNFCRGWHDFPNHSSSSQKLLTRQLPSAPQVLPMNMPLNKYKSVVLSGTMIIVFTMTFFFTPDCYGRDGLKLYSQGNNSAWNTAGTWSLTSGGPVSAFVPQANDTIIVQTSVIQNVNILFSESGCLEVVSSGLLRGDNLDLSFTGNSLLISSGEIKSNNLSFEDNASFFLNENAKITVNNSFTNNSLFIHEINGRLIVNGIFSSSLLTGFTGKGTIKSVEFQGNGSVFSLSQASLIPGGSLVSESNWIGTSNSNWADPINWSANVVPSNNSNISVLSSSHNPIVADFANCGNLYVNQSSVLIVNPGAVIDISGNISVIEGGKLLLKNTISVKSSLLFDGDVSGKIQVEYPVVAGKNALISSPVSNAVTGTFLNMYLRSYDETASQWGEYIVPTEDEIVSMQGYELFSVYNETRIFEGTPINVSKSFAISNEGNGLNLTGNPFPSYIDWENNENGAWQRSSIASAIYYPDPSGSGNFAVYMPGGDDAVSINNGSRYISPMQGFFVKASQKGALMINEKSCVRNITDSKTALKNNSVKFKLTDSDGMSDEVMFRVIANSSFGFDDNLDAIKFEGSATSNSLFFGSDDDIRYALNTIPTVNSSLEIPLYITCVKSGMFSVSAAGAFNFEYRYPVILEDTELGLFIDLRADSVYSFYHTTEMNSNRFKIHFNSTQDVDQQGDGVSEVVVYPGEVRINGTENDIYTAKLYTTDGKMISSAKGILSEGIILSTGNTIASGICILQLTNGRSKMTKKIFVN